MSCIDSLTSEGTQSEDPAGEVTGYWLFACSVSTAKVNRWACHLFTPLSAPDRESHGTESRKIASDGKDNSWTYLQVAKCFDSLYCLIKCDFCSSLYLSSHKCLEGSCNGRSRVVRRSAALFTFLHDVPLNIYHLTPEINFSRDEVGRNSWNPNISLMYIPIHLFIRSIATCQSQRGGFVFIFRSILVLKNRPPQLPPGNPRCHTSSTIPGHQKLTTFELSLLQTAESVELNKTCQPKQAGV